MNHFPLLKQYARPLDTELTYPVDSQMTNVASDPWEWQPGYNKAQPTPNNKTLWAESGGDVAKYKAAFIVKYGSFKRPFSESTMMVAPVEWRTGYDDNTEQSLSILATMQGEAKEVKSAIGVVNNAIQDLESLLYQVQNNLSTKTRLRSNKQYVGLAEREAPEELATLDSDIVALKSLEGSYQTELASLRINGQVLNQELTRELKVYKDTAAALNIDDGFAARLEKEKDSSYFWGRTQGGVGGIIVAGIAIYLLASSRRGAARRTRTTKRGADGLFFRA